MALRKLTLTIDDALIDKARGYSAEHDTSISRLVSHFLAGLPAEEQRYSPAVRRLSGLLPADARADDYHGHLERKYQG